MQLAFVSGRPPPIVGRRGAGPPSSRQIRRRGGSTTSWHQGAIAAYLTGADYGLFRSSLHRPLRSCVPTGNDAPTQLQQRAAASMKENLDGLSNPDQLCRDGGAKEPRRESEATGRQLSEVVQRL